MRACRSRLVIAVRPGAGSGLLSQVLRQYSGPESELVSTRQRADAVRQGIAGAALVCVGSDDLTGLQGVELGEEFSVVLLPKNHRLAGRAGVAADLEGEPGYRAQCTESRLDEIMDRVAHGRLVTVVGSAATDRLPSEVSAVPVTDLPPTTLALCWLSGTSTPGLPALVGRRAPGSC